MLLFDSIYQPPVYNGGHFSTYQICIAGTIENFYNEIGLI
jgi:hypothetical protein